MSVSIITEIHLGRDYPPHLAFGTSEKGFEPTLPEEPHQSEKRKSFVIRYNGHSNPNPPKSCVTSNTF